jgi:hypothetical protein
MGGLRWREGLQEGTRGAVELSLGFLLSRRFEGSSSGTQREAVLARRRGRLHARVRAQDDAHVDPGAPGRRGHGLDRAVWCIIWQGKGTGSFLGVRRVYWTWCGRAEVRGGEDGMVVTRVIGMVLSLRFWCLVLVSVGMARSSGVRQGELTRLS